METHDLGSPSKKTTFAPRYIQKCYSILGTGLKVYYSYVTLMQPLIPDGALEAEVDEGLMMDIDQSPSPVCCVDWEGESPLAREEHVCLCRSNFRMDMSWIWTL